MIRNRIKTKFRMHEVSVYILCGVLFAGLFLTGCAHTNPEGRKQAGSGDEADMLKSALDEAGFSKTGDAVIDPGSSQETVQIGDLAGVRYCLTLESGEILRTNIRELLDSSETILSDNFIESAFRDLEVLAGERDSFPGLQNGVMGMKKGETDNIVISPAEAYGPRSEERVRSLSSVRLLPKKTVVTPEKFHGLFKSMPVEGNTVHLAPYFNHRITEVNEKEVVLETDIKDAFTLKSEIGDTRISPEEDNIAITLEPRVGADFSAGNEEGRIVSVEEKSFTVDFNHPLAGKTLLLEFTVDSVIKASTVRNWEIPWHDGYDEGLTIAEKSGKPVVLVLYRDGCPWCEKLFKTTMKDPRIEYFDNEFIWIKANEKEHPELVDLYKTDSYPSIVLLDSKGDVVEKMPGYKYAYVLRDNLSSALQKIEKASSVASADEGPEKSHLTIN